MQTVPSVTFEKLWKELEGDPQRMEAFFKDPQVELQAFDIPVIQSMGKPNEPASAPMADAAPVAAAAAADTSGVGASVHWWGVDITMDPTVTAGIIGGTIATGALSGAIGGAFVGISSGVPGLAAIGAGLAVGMAAVALVKAGEVALVSMGKGVHWPVTWPQWAELVAVLPSGPAGVEGSLVLFWHPFPN